MWRGAAAAGISPGDSYVGKPGRAAGFAGRQRTDCALYGDAGGYDRSGRCVYRELCCVFGRRVARKGSGDAGEFVRGDVDDEGGDPEVVSDGRGVCRGVESARGEGVGQSWVGSSAGVLLAAAINARGWASPAPTKVSWATGRWPLTGRRSSKERKCSFCTVMRGR